MRRIRRFAFVLASVAWALLFLRPVLAEDSGPAPAPLRGVVKGNVLDLAGVSDAALKKDLERYRGTDAEFAWEMTPVKTGPGDFVEAYALTFPSPVETPWPENNVVHCEFYPPHNVPAGTRVPAVAVLHHLGGDFTIEKVLADYLARSGVAALYVELPFYGPRRPKDDEKVKEVFSGRNFELYAEGTRQAVLDVRRAGDWLLARPDVDPRRLGVVGISLGAMLGSLVGGIDPRFSRDVLIIGGGDLPAIFTHPSRETRGVRKAIEEQGLDRAKLEALLAPVEPCRYAHRLRGADVLMLNAEMDEIIPRAATDALWKALGEPEIVWYKAGHVTIAAYLMELMQRTRDHVLKPAKEKAPAPRARKGGEAF